MPLHYSKSHKAFQQNVAQLIRDKKPKAQALAIAYSIMRGDSKKPKHENKIAQMKAKACEGECSCEKNERCWQGYKPVPGKKPYSKGSCTKEESAIRKSDSPNHKYMVTLKTGKKVYFGDPNMRIKSNNPKRKKSFCARHKCAQKHDKEKPGYWSCKKWHCKTGTNEALEPQPEPDTMIDPAVKNFSKEKNPTLTL